MSEIIAGAESPAAPKDASTVILVRDGASGPEVFLQRRVDGMAFAAGVTVFPGGGVDVSDSVADIGWAGPDAAWWGERFGVGEDRARALVCAAVRELFEECGVLLAGPTADTVVTEAETHSAVREQLVRRELTLGEFLSRERLVLRADLLRPWANWITPEISPRRYDTHFFVAMLPAGQRADGATSEASEVRWATPAAVLDSWRAGADELLGPTWTQLRTLHGFASAADLFAADRDIETVLPVLERGGDRIRLVFPDCDAYYADLPAAHRRW
ncbi:NUDIX hydrolase [Nocardia aurantia]|uniref:Nudix hydrolase domain-containing protein n=1 Tax=Nocardia aurantia TaxID=2585199 RepID=A0A7K0DUQ1_9NOCA|nr:NUDIX hydrolase [Nocardia aurantia]MQY29493.1 hypothetical protein [Nocardia aurantia]